MVGERISNYTKDLASGAGQSVTDIAARVSDGKPLPETGQEILARSKARRRSLLGM